MPDPKDPTPAKAVQRGGKWVVVGADGRALKGQSGKLGVAEAKALAARVNRTWGAAKSERRSNGSLEVTEAASQEKQVGEAGFDARLHPRSRGGRFRKVLSQLERRASDSERLAAASYRFGVEGFNRRSIAGAKATLSDQKLSEGVWPLSGGPRMVTRFDPARHPRNRVGEFRDILGRVMKAGHGSRVDLPHGVRVRSHLGALELERPGGERRRLNDPHLAAVAAIHAVDDVVGSPVPHNQKLHELGDARLSAMRTGNFQDVVFADQSAAALRRLRGEREPTFHTAVIRGRSKTTTRAYAARTIETPQSLQRLATDLKSVGQANYGLPFKRSRLSDSVRPRLLAGGTGVETGYGTYRIRPHPQVNAMYEMVLQVGTKEPRSLGLAGQREGAMHEILRLHDEAMERYSLKPGRKKNPDMDPVEAKKLYELVPIGSKWYAFGRHVEIVKHIDRDGEPGLRDKDLKTGKVLLTTPIEKFLKKATREG